jgi:D-alanyl-D-alanine carboxypeptidase
MTGLLAGLAARADRDVAFSSLSVSGVDGTLDDRLTEAPYRGRVLGKTGYIAGVSCLSGYVLDRAGRPAVAFAVLVNRCRGSAHAKRLQDSVCRALVDWLDA